MKRKANEEYSGRLGGGRAGGAAERSRLTVQKCRFGNSCPLARSPPLISSPCSFSQPLISQGEGGRGEIAIFLSLFLSPFQTAALIIFEDLLMLR